MERVNAISLPNKRYRASNKSSSIKVQSVLAPTLHPPVASVPLSTSEPISTTAANSETPLKLVIKTPVNQNSASIAHAPRTQQQLTFTNSDSATTFSSIPNNLFPFPFVEQIAKDILESIIKNSHYKSSLEALIRKNILFKYKPHIIKTIQMMLANTRSRSYISLDEIVVACLHNLGF